MAKGSGINGRSDSAGTGQCINSSLPHDWYITGQPGGRVRTDRRSRSPTCPLSIPSDSLSASTRTQLVLLSSGYAPDSLSLLGYGPPLTKLPLSDFPACTATT